MVLTNVSASLIAITSVIGDVSNIAAIRGSTAFEKAEEPAKIWENLNLSWIAVTKGVMASGKNPFKLSDCAVNTLPTPLSLEACSATYKQRKVITKRLTTFSTTIYSFTAYNKIIILR